MVAFEETEDPWVAAMRAGDFAAAWGISDAVLRARIASGEQCWHWPRHQQFVWRGETLAGKRVLVRCYHGLGDTLQFIRFVAPLRATARSVTVWCQRELMPLVRTAPGVDEVIALTDGVPDVDCDADIEVMELAHALRANNDALGAKVPYLRAPTRMRRHLPTDRPNVGVVWEAGGWDRRRSVPTPLIRDLARTEGVNFISLQRGAAAEYAPELGLQDASSDDVAATAALIGELDLTITVDTMVAHLAGALGRPVWTLLHAESDWRWMEAREDTPWYPTMRLFRQTQPGDWRPVIAAVCEVLAAKLPGTGTRP